MNKADAKIAFLKMVANLIFAGPSTVNVQVIHPNIANDTHTVAGRSFNNKWGQTPIRGFDINIRTDEGIVKLRFLEQNPDKKDGMGNLTTYAQMARQGHKIVWVLRIDTQPNEWLGRIQDGEWIQNQIRAYTTSQASKTANPRQAQDQYGQGYSLNDGQWVNNLTNMVPADIPDHLEQSAEVDGI